MLSTYVTFSRHWVDREKEHEYRPINMLFTAMDRVQPNVRGGDLDCMVLQRETQCIHLLRTTHPPGLNEAVSLKSFL